MQVLNMQLPETDLHDLTSTVEDHLLQETLARLRLGKRLLEAQKNNAPDDPETIAAVAGLDWRSAKKAMAIAKWLDDEVKAEELLRRRGAGGMRLTWDHLVHLLKVGDKVIPGRPRGIDLGQGLHSEEPGHRPPPMEVPAG